MTEKIEKTYHILNLGAGVQSTALYLMSHHQDEPEFVPRFDCAIFADTQDESRAVYGHLQWVASVGDPPILTDSRGSLGRSLIAELSLEEYDQASWNLRFNQQLEVMRREAEGYLFGHVNPAELTDGPEREAAIAFLADPQTEKRSLGTHHHSSIPAFTADHEGIPEGIMTRQCTKDYKVSVVEEVIRRKVVGIPKRARFPEDVHIIQYLGISYDEGGRIARIRGRYESIRWAEPRFPLFDMQMTRADCVAYLKDRCPHPVPRSACIYCPYRCNAEWREMRDNDPESWARACEVDERMRHPRARCGIGMNSKLYLHRSCVPLRQAAIDKDEPPIMQHTMGFARECDGMCGS